MGRAGGNSTQRDVAFEDAERPAVVREDACDVRVGSGYVGAAAFDIE